MNFVVLYFGKKIKDFLHALIDHKRHISHPFSSEKIYLIAGSSTQSRRILCELKSRLSFQLVYHLKKILLCPQRSEVKITSAHMQHPLYYENEFLCASIYTENLKVKFKFNC
jgi:hypothetical protein